MFSKYFILPIMGLAAAIALIAAEAEAARPKPRPLGNGLESYHAPTAPPEAVELRDSRFEDPTGPLPLREALSLALMRNPRLRSYAWGIREQEARKIQAGLYPNPTVSIDLENAAGTGSLKDMGRAETTLRLSQLVILAGKREKEMRAVSLEGDLASWDYEAARIDVLTATAKAFIDVLAAQEKLALSKTIVDIAERAYQAVRERVLAGKAPPVEETKANVECASVRIEQEKAERNLSVARARLASLWGSGSPTFAEARGSLKAIDPIPPMEKIKRLLSRNPDIARWGAEIEARRAAVALERAKAIPDITFAAGARRFEETEDSAFVFGISIPIPVFDRNQGSYLRARFNLSGAEEEKKAAAARVESATAGIYGDLSNARAEAVALRDEVIPGAEEVFMTIREGYRRGKFDYLDVLDAQRVLFEKQARYINALASYHKAAADMEGLTGTPLVSGPANKAAPGEGD